MSRNRPRHRRPAPKAARLPDAMPEVVIDGVGAQGDGIADWNGKTLYAEGALPGERVRLRPVAAKGDGFSCEIVEILTPSADRAEPFCPHFATCGGCRLQHWAAPAVARWKRDLVATTLRQRGLSVAVEDTRSTAPGGRRRAAFSVLHLGGGKAALGFNARASHRIVDIDQCPLLTPALNRVIGRLRDWLRGKIQGPGDILVTETETGLDVVLAAPLSLDLAGREAAAQLADALDLAQLSAITDPDLGPEMLARRRGATIRLGGVGLEIPPGPFLQPSLDGQAILQSLVIEQIGADKRIADLYCGLGTFALPLAQGGATVWAVDGNRAGIDAMQAAAGRGDLGGRIRAEVRDLERDPPSVRELSGLTAAVFDPPRSGARATAEALAESPIKRLAAVSCNPATFARDARILIDGGFELTRVVPVDQFPSTPHVELFAAFRRA